MICLPTHQFGRGMFGFSRVKSILTAFFLADLSTRIIFSVPKILLGTWPRVNREPRTSRRKKLVRVLFKFPSPAKKRGSEKNDDIFGFRPMEVLGTKTPAFFFEVKFVYISCTNVENYLPSNNFGYRTIFIFFVKRDHKLRHQNIWCFVLDVCKVGPIRWLSMGLKNP